MTDRQDQARPLPLQREEKSVTSKLFEAYLACPTKCYLQSIDATATNNNFAIWNETQSENYRCEGAQRITTSHQSKLALKAPETGHWRNVSWHFILNLVARAKNMEADIQVVQHIPPEEQTNHPSSFRFVLFPRTNFRAPTN